MSGTKLALAVLAVTLAAEGISTREKFKGYSKRRSL